jgi:NAD dependent epimerase/dehydratase family enzyme
VVAPNPVDNAELTAILSRVIKRRAFLPVPSFAVKALFGEMGRTLLLHGTRVVPRKLLAAGYTFKFPSLEGALRHLLEG